MHGIKHHTEWSNHVIHTIHTLYSDKQTKSPACPLLILERLERSVYDGVCASCVAPHH